MIAWSFLCLVQHRAQLLKTMSQSECHNQLGEVRFQVQAKNDLGMLCTQISKFKVVSAHILNLSRSPAQFSWRSLRRLLARHKPITFLATGSEELS